MQPYPPEVEAIMRSFYQSLNEKDRRRYAGIEASKFGHGGRVYIARIWAVVAAPSAKAPKR
jgi:hypothetical protein